MSANGGQIDYPALLKQGYVQLKAMRERVESLERAKREPIAIVGIGCRFPGGGDGPDAFWSMLRGGVDATREIPASRWDVDAYYDADPDRPGRMYVRRGAFLDAVDEFDAGFFGISPRECASMDPQQRLLLEVAWEAIENAGAAREQLAGRSVGVCVGAMFHDYAHLIASAGLQHVDAHFGSGNGIAFMAGRLSYHLGLQGPSLVLDTACSSSLVAVHLACQSLRTGETDVGLACGVNLILSPLSSVVMCRLRALAPDGRCKTFDAAADGYARGEGCGVVILKRLSDAVAAGDRIWAVIRGSAVNQDGAGAGITVPNGLSQQAVIRQAIAEAKVDPARLGYIETHGTGTRLGDPLELRALWSALRDGRDLSRPLVVGSLKTNVGHMEGAAGIGSLIKTVLALRHGEIPPHLNVRQLNPLIADEGIPLQIPREPMAWPVADGPRLAGVSSFGMSGTNVHMIVEQAEDVVAPVQSDEPGRTHILCLSARSDAELRELAGRYCERLSADRGMTLADVCFTAAVGRTHHACRLAIAADSIEACVRGLDLWLDRDGPRPGGHANDLAQRYANGETIDWSQVYAGQRYRKVGLPTYPFQRRRYWADVPAHTDPAADDSPSAVDDLLYQVCWRPHELGEPARVSSERRDCLLFGDGRGFAAQLATALESTARRCTLVGGSRPAAAEIVSAIRAAATEAQGTPLDVFYLGDLDLADRPDSRSIADAGAVVLPGLLQVMQSIARVPESQALRLWVVTRGVHAVTAPGECRRPAGGTLWGLGKVFGLEHAERWGGLIDLAAVPSGDDARCVVRQINAADGEDQVAYRDGRRFAARLERAELGMRRDMPRFDVEGVYWITGGLGAVGLQVAEWLVDRGARHLVLQGRRGLPDRAHQDRAELSQGEAAKPIAAVRRLESRGAEVHVLAADVSDDGFLPRARQLLGGLNRPLRAIHHAAGVSGLCSIADMTEADLQSVLSAKLAGTWNLHELARDFPEAQLVCFSSIASVWGSRSLGHYAAANEFLDCFTAFRAGEGLPAVSVNWGPLAGGGMGLEQEEARLGQVGIRALAREQFRTVLDRAVQAKTCSLTAACVDWAVFKPLYEAQRRRPLVESIGVAEPTSKASADHAEREQLLALSGEDRRRSAESFLLDQTAAVLKTDVGELDAAQPLTALGIDSLMAMEVQKRIQTRLGVTVPISDFLQGASIGQLARTVAAGLNGHAAARGGSAAKPELVEGEL